MKKPNKYGYHSSPIPKGIYGESSKLVEEVLELVDAEKQGIRIMIPCELSDIYGALEAYSWRLGYTMKDLAAMSEVTRNAFATGQRKS